MGDYSVFLTKMAELKAIQGEYNQLSMDISGAVSTDTNYDDNTFDKYEYTPDKNPISNTKTPLVIAPGEDYAEFWKYVGKITPVASSESESQKKNAQKCWNLAANDPRPFKKVVYTGNTGVNLGQPKWDNLCYGLVPDAPASASFDSNVSNGYAFMAGNGDGGAGKTNGIYTKLGINPSGANQAKRKDMNSVYAEINEQTTLRARKYKFIFFIIVAIVIIIGYGSYTSKMSLLEQIDSLRNYIGWGWWTNWWIIAIVVIVFIISSFGWDMKGNITTFIRYVTNPDFWTGQLWWVGVTFLMLIMIFLYASFKSFFAEFDAGMKSIQSSLDGESS